MFSIMFILLLTKLLGFLKLRIFAQLFGASHELDIFWAAFTIPDMVFMILVAGSVNAAVIPILTDVLYDKGKKHFNKVFMQLTAVFFALCITLVTLLFVFTPQLTSWLVENDYAQRVLNFSFRISESDYDTFVRLLRIGLLSPLLLGISGFITAYLQVRKKFFITSLAPLFYNVAMMVGPIILVSYFKMGVEALAISAVIGSLIHLLIQLPELLKYCREENHFFLDIKGALRNSDVIKAIKLAIPRALGILGEQINVVVNTFISFTLSAGTLSAYRFAYSLHLFPINIIGSAVAQVTLPDLAALNTKNNHKDFVKVLNNAIQLSLYLVFPITAILLVLRLPIVRLIYGTGAFDWQDTLLTAWSLALLSLSIIGQTVVQIILRAFYAMKNTWLPLVAIIFGIVVNLLGAYFLTNFFSHYYDWRPILEQIWIQISQANGEGLAPVLGSFFKDAYVWMTTRGDSSLAIGGLALSLSLAYFIEMIVSVLLLNIKIHVLSWKDMIQPTLTKLLNTLIMILGMYFVFRLFDFQFDTSRTVYVIILTGVTSLYGGISYLIGSKIFAPKEFKQAEILIKKIIRKDRSKISNLE